MMHLKFNIYSFCEAIYFLKKFPSWFLDPPGIPSQNFVQIALPSTSIRYYLINVVVNLTNSKLRKIPISIIFLNKLNQRIVPSLIRLADDLTGKEAGWETTIGDKQNVNKHIN